MRAICTYSIPNERENEREKLASSFTSEFIDQLASKEVFGCIDFDERQRHLPSYLVNKREPGEDILFFGLSIRSAAKERFQYLFLEKFSRLVNKWQKQDFQECARLAKGFSSWRLVRKEDVECLYVTSVLEAFCIMERNSLFDAERRAFLFEYVWYAFMHYEIPAILSKG